MPQHWRFEEVQRLVNNNELGRRLDHATSAAAVRLLLEHCDVMWSSDPRYVPSDEVIKGYAEKALCPS